MSSNDSNNTGAMVTALTAVAAPTVAAHFSAPVDGVTFSQAGLTIIAFLLGTLAAVITLLFRLLLASKDAQIAELTRLAFRSTDTTQKALEHAERERSKPQ